MAAKSRVEIMANFELHIKISYILLGFLSHILLLLSIKSSNITFHKYSNMNAVNVMFNFLDFLIY